MAARQTLSHTEVCVCVVQRQGPDRLEAVRLVSHASEEQAGVRRAGQ